MMSEKKGVQDVVSITGNSSRVSRGLSEVKNATQMIITNLQKKVAELEKQNEKLQNELEQTAKHAMIDHLTGCYNHLFVERIMKQRVFEKKRNKESWGLIIFDIDHFKAINDAYGHPCGDQVLVNVTQMFREVARQSDYIVRHGGDEFLIFMLNLGEEDVKPLAQRYKNSISAVQTDQADCKLSVTVSFGVCFVPSDSSMELDLVIKYADEALYRAKSAGRNCICFHDRRKVGERSGFFDDRRK
ncbi:MAG: hypothetical protein CR972_03020 [Candidatus Moraniibacteriota bacterium]|nr:MAG: hypothetical protein CR972_03020 [Candidatus Moranbacteria bacterium]